MSCALNSQAVSLCDAASARAAELGIATAAESAAIRLLDFGVQVPGSIEAGCLLARICLAGRGTVEVGHFESPEWLSVSVETDSPLLACMGCQYAGWPVQANGFFAMGSGPLRLVRGAEKVLQEYELNEDVDEGVLVLESRKLPPWEVLQQLAASLPRPLRRLHVCVAATHSLAGTLQIIARSVESACHKLHELGFDLKVLRSGRGLAPLLTTSATEPNAEELAMGRCNDAILLAGSVVLQVDCDDDVLRTIGPQTPSCASPQFGVPFATLLKAVDGDFYRLDPHLFAPASLEFENQRTGASFRFGSVRRDLLPAHPTLSTSGAEPTA